MELEDKDEDRVFILSVLSSQLNNPNLTEVERNNIMENIRQVGDGKNVSKTMEELEAMANDRGVSVEFLKILYALMDKHDETLKGLKDR